MKAKQIYLKTMGFMWLKLGLGVITAIISMVWISLCFYISNVFGGYAILIGLIIGTGGVKAIHGLIHHYIGYILKAGHIAVIAEAAVTGAVPENPYFFAVQQVKYRFISANIYFMIDKLIDGAIKELKGGIDKADKLFGNIPGMSLIFSFIKIFTGIALGYVDECCIGYSFIRKDKGVIQCACDSIVIYFQNWKKLFKKSAVITVFVMLSYSVSFIIIKGMLSSMLAMFVWNKLIAFVIAVLLTISIHHAFIDSYILISMMVSFIQVSEQTEVTYDLYGRLCNLSGKFKKLFEKSKDEIVEC